VGTVAAVFGGIFGRPFRRGRPELFDALFRLDPDPVVIVDGAGRILAVNPAARRFLYDGASGIEGRPLARFVRPETLGPLRQRLGRGDDPSEEEPLRVEMLRPGLAPVPAEVRLSHLRSDPQHRTILTFRDLSERESLVHALTDRAAQLARSNRDLQEFAYVASHDLQEPLRMVASYTQLVAERYGGKLDRDADEFLGYATEGATRMRSLIDDLLAYARVEARGAPFREFPAAEALSVALRNLEPAIQASGGRVEVGTLPEILGDPGQIAQVFQNLIGNSLKFHAQDPPVVEVRAQPVATGWEFSVRDNGIGIPPAYAERVFQVFQRLQRREEYPGSGIGLSIAKRVLERHGGRIWIESSGRSGEGTTVRFTIPRLGAAAARAAPPSPGSPERVRAERLAEELVARRLAELV
jgi:PAS domain S-box-containing protein